MTIAAPAAGLGATQSALYSAVPTAPPDGTAASSGTAGTDRTAAQVAAADSSPQSPSAAPSSETSKSATGKPRLATNDLPTTIAIGQIGTSTFAAVVQRSTNQILYTIPPGYLTDLANAGYLSHTGYDLRT